ncbi:MAG: nucleotidyltransferase domain-containing protein [Patescibacteria group bacterium]|nr:nucleotidyltransferase domain-containing protein [Patescibacteria group bacterium]
MHTVSDLLEQLKRLNPEAIVLFGSRARNQETPESDVDILLIQKTEKPFFERIRDVYLSLSTTIPTDIIVLTPEEAQTLPKHNSFFAEILKNGNVVYGRI